MRIAALFHPKAKKWVAGRKLPLAQYSPEDKCIWMHCASAGEYEQGRPVFAALKKLFPNKKFILSFFSPSGYEFHQEDEIADEIFYLPFDKKAQIEKLLDHIQVELFIAVKYDYWFHLFSSIKAREIPLVVVAATFRENQRYFSWQSFFWRTIFECVDCFFVQDEDSKRLLIKHKYSEIFLAGDPRMDRVQEVANQSFYENKWRNCLKPNPVFIAGSTWPEDDKLLLKLAKERLDLSFIIVPHEIKEEHLLLWESTFNEDCVRSSAINDFENQKPKRIILVDQMGVLSRLYRLADISYVGGGFGDGIHNILEPAAYGLPIIIGPNFQGFREAETFVESGFTAVVTNYQDLQNTSLDLLELEKREEIKSGLENYFRRNANVSQKIAEEIVIRFFNK